VSFFKRRSFWDKLDFIAVVVAAISGAVTAAVPADSKAIPAVFVCLSGIAAATGKFVSKLLENREKTGKATQEAQEREERGREANQLREKYAAQAKRIVEAILERMRSEYFRNEKDEAKYMHRATLFICVEADLVSGHGKHLAIFARAGVHKDSTRTWPLDDNDPGKCRGVAGKIWFHGVNTGVSVADCDWPTGGDPEGKARYAKSLDITVEEAEGLNVRSKIFTGAPIMAKGRKWGVLLLDSRKEGHIKHDQYERTMLDRYAELLGAVLEGIEP
jgi:hypothetical protein